AGDQPFGRQHLYRLAHGAATYPELLTQFRIGGQAFVLVVETTDDLTAQFLRHPLGEIKISIEKRHKTLSITGVELRQAYRLDWVITILLYEANQPSHQAVFVYEKCFHVG